VTSIARATSSQPTSRSEPSPTARGEKYAAGAYLQANGGLNRSGRIGDYITEFAVSRDRKTVIVVMCNGHTSNR